MPIGIQNFESLRGDGYLYVDKTQLIYRLVTTGRYYFLSRPRRFGKSLRMSTIHSYFSGRRDLFEGLAIEKLEKQWIEYPVLHLDLNTQQYNAPEKLAYVINDFLLRHERKYGIGGAPDDNNFGPRFENLIRTSYSSSAS